MNQYINKRYPVTNGLLLVTTLVFLVLQILRFGRAEDAYAIYEFGGLYGLALKLEPWQLWRLVSPIFVHIGWQHFLFNGFTLYALGYQLEGLFGSRRFLMLYLLAGIMGDVFVFFFTPDVVSAGASTSLFGLFGAMVLLRYHSRSPYVQVLGQRYTALLVMNMVITLLNPSISLAGHLGGAVGGCLAVIFLPPQGEKHLFTSKQTVLALGTYLLLLLALLGLGFIVI